MEREGGFYDLESSHEVLNSYESFFFLEELQLLLVYRSMQLMFCEFKINHS